MSGVRMIGGELKPPLDEDLLEHFGIKGMQWGVRRSGLTGVHPKTDRQAHKDAKEFARAKMFYGKGAGTRRKLIKAKVEANKKNIPNYAKAFDHHLARQDMGTHASKAQSERTRKNRVDTGKKTTMAVLRRATGQYGNAAAITAVTAAGLVWMNSPHGRRVLGEALIGKPF